MDLHQAITRMSAAGVIMRANGDRLAVESRAPLTDQQRAWIRTHKGDLLRLLSAPRPVPVELTDDQREALREAYEERAAIREIEGGETRMEAEALARSAQRVYQYRLSDNPGTWLILLCPGCDLEDARHHLTWRFGARLLEVIEHRPASGTRDVA